MKPKFSIIIPVYNSAKYISKLIDSILVQDYNCYEIIIVDDGSTDNSLELVKDYQKKSDKIVVINTENSGPGIARKIGFEKSVGEYLLFADSDDLFPNKKVLSGLDDLTDRRKFDILFYSYYRVTDEKAVITNGLSSTSVNDGIYDIAEIEKYNIVSALWCKLFVRKKMKSEFFTNSRNLEDCFTTFHYINGCKNFCYYSGICYTANRSVNGSLSKQNQLKKIPESVRVLKSTYNVTNYKKSLFYTIAEYYTAMRRLVAKSKLSKEKKKDLIKTLLELKHIIKKDKRELIRANWKIIAKYFYYSLGDFRYEK